jgi:ATP-binding cassette subfamily B protein
VAEETSAVQETLSAYEVEGFSLTNVSFDYGREKVLQGVSLSVKNGESICIVGNSGSGKSTLFKLLLGVYKPTSGEMVLTTTSGENVDYAAKPTDMFAYVPQGNFLFSGTIKENLLFFAEGDVSETDINDALSIAQAEFVYELPNGIDTILSERGAGLSEGQQQRLAIARALLSNRPVLLLDEATSALDSETEGKLLSAIKSLEGKTCIMVTHRPAALAIADRVYRILDGTIEVL